jgi:hypothetical protein
MLNRRTLNLPYWLIVWITFMTMNAVSGENVILYLRNGDRIKGSVISENTNSVTLSTVWIKELAVPLAEIEKREVLPVVAVSTTNAAPVITATNAVVATTNAPAATNKSVVVTTPPVTTSNSTAVAKIVSSKPVSLPAQPPKTPWLKRWKGTAAVGMDLIYGSRDTQLYHGNLALTYAQPYQRDPKKFFRNILTYNAEYGSTEGVLSANRMIGSSKTDFDLGRSIYVYNLIGGGYDEIRKIDIGYQVGPGFGYHLFTLTNFVMNVELGGNYQAEYRSDNTTTENFFIRFGQDVNWKINKQMSLVEKFEFFPQIGTFNEYRFRFEATLSQALLSRVSLNLTLVDIFDSNPAAGVSRNEIQVRSSLGVNF